MGLTQAGKIKFCFDSRTGLWGFELYLVWGALTCTFSLHGTKPSSTHSSWKEHLLISLAVKHMVIVIQIVIFVVLNWLLNISHADMRSCACSGCQQRCMNFIQTLCCFWVFFNDAAARADACIQICISYSEWFRSGDLQSVYAIRPIKCGLLQLFIHSSSCLPDWLPLMETPELMISYLEKFLMKTSSRARGKNRWPLQHMSFFPGNSEAESHATFLLFPGWMESILPGSPPLSIL